MIKSQLIGPYPTFPEISFKKFLKIKSFDYPELPLFAEKFTKYAFFLQYPVLTKS